MKQQQKNCEVNTKELIFNCPLFLLDKASNTNLREKKANTQQQSGECSHIQVSNYNM